MPQKGSVDWDFPTTALDVVMMGTYGSLGWIKRSGMKEKKNALEALEKVDMLSFKHRQISQLSGGQQQRIFLARALVQDASIYFMDEPFQGVDATTEIAIINILKALRTAGKTVVVVVHHDLQTVPTKTIDVLITSFIVIAIVIGLQTVGVVLMSALLLAPAAAARQWTNNLGMMVIIAAILGACAGVFGTAISASQNNLSTGPVIVLVASVFVLFSFIFSPKRGLLFRQFRLIQNRNDLELRKTLTFMYHIVEDHKDSSHPHSIKILNNFRGYSRKGLQKLVHKNYVRLDGEMWRLTPKGFQTAKNLYNQNQKDD